MPALVYNWHLQPSIEGPVLDSIGENDTSLAPGERYKDTNEDGSPGTSTSSSAIIVGHHKVPENFNPPPNYIQPNNKLKVISNKDDEREVSSFADIFGTKQLPSCPVEPTTSLRQKIKEKSFSFFKHFDDLMKNQYFWTIFTVVLGSILPVIRNIYNERKKVTIIIPCCISI
jgi:hypothetical protein